MRANIFLMSWVLSSSAFAGGSVVIVGSHSEDFKPMRADLLGEVEDTLFLKIHRKNFTNLFQSVQSKTSEVVVRTLDLEVTGALVETQFEGVLSIRTSENSGVLIIADPASE